MSEADWGAQAQAWLDRLAQCSEPGPGVTRLPFSPEHRAALAVLTELMREAGLSVSLDAAGTLIGRCDGPPGAPALLMGSHQDSVCEGGGYDGIMGVVVCALAMMKLRADGFVPPFAVEVLAFADEEGVRFPTALMGPRVLADTFDMAALELRDGAGQALREAMAGFGLAPDALPGLKRDPAQVLGWIECHLEQGPVLEDEGLTLGVVTAISGIERHSVRLTGQAAHAGTVPMSLRRDALAAAAEIVLAVERVARESDGVLATVGMLELRPGVVNAVPGEVALTIEIRSPSDAVRAGAAEEITARVAEIATRRQIAHAITRSYAQPATPCDPSLRDLLSGAVHATTGRARLLPSGATHDTSAMADLCPVGMIFTACAGGISHHPAETVPMTALHDAVLAMAGAVTAIARRVGETAP
ncbi:M20 family metallo-hydrolase [Rhodovulum steppense]|uniref:Allantoate deiminase n=1 Tax=Rhodovulum steppense TaxID=540251 RepID=A0A4R1Z0N8_9RHOB|nr:M20 family metallo-hydrolase [Rhodovulum steppense]TCM87139.1 allantoate deiminase [Rhodovulum steppense]